MLVSIFLKKKTTYSTPLSLSWQVRAFSPLWSEVLAPVRCSNSSPRLRDGHSFVILPTAPQGQAPLTPRGFDSSPPWEGRGGQFFGEVWAEKPEKGMGSAQESIFIVQNPRMLENCNRERFPWPCSVSDQGTYPWRTSLSLGPSAACSRLNNFYSKDFFPSHPSHLI